MVVGIGQVPRQRVCSQRWIPCFARSALKILKSWRMRRKSALRLIETRKCHAYRTSVCSVRRKSTPTLSLGCLARSAWRPSNSPLRASSYVWATYTSSKRRLSLQMNWIRHRAHVSARCVHRVPRALLTHATNARQSTASRRSSPRSDWVWPITTRKKEGDRGFTIHDPRTSGGLFDEL